MCLKTLAWLMFETGGADQTSGMYRLIFAFIVPVYNNSMRHEKDVCLRYFYTPRKLCL